MSAIVGNRIGSPPSTRKVTDRLNEPTMPFDKEAVERRILFFISDEERLYGPLSYTGSQADALREVARGRPPLPESPRPVQ